jgi:hypothetical protein
MQAGTMKKVLFILMIFPVCFVMFNNAAYRHQHILPDGQTIEHAHPFQPCKKGDATGHQHTKSEILLYSIISDSPVIVMLLPLVLGVYRLREPDIKVTCPRDDFSNAPVLFKPLRAPPSMVHIPDMISA